MKDREQGQGAEITARKREEEAMNPTICRGNLQRTNAYPGPGVRTLHGLRWTYTAKDALGFTPLLTQGTLFFMDRGATVYALDIQEGTERWSVSPPWQDQGSEFPRGKKQGFQFFDPFCSGTLTNTTLYVPWKGSPEPALCGLSLQDGHIVSRYEMNDRYELNFSSIVGDLLIGINGSHLCAFDLHQQHLKWVVEGYTSNTPPAFDEQRQRIYVSDLFEGNHNYGGLYAFDLNTGEKVWSVQGGDGLTLSPTPPLLLEGHVYMSAMVEREEDEMEDEEDGWESVICAFDAETGQQTWQYSDHPMVITSELAASPGTFYYARRVKETRWEMCALDIQSQQLRWTAPVAADVYYAPVLADGVLYAATDEGTLHAFDLITGTPLWTFATHQRPQNLGGSQVPSSPWCIAENMVFFRAANTIYALH